MTFFYKGITAKLDLGAQITTKKVQNFSDGMK